MLSRIGYYNISSSSDGPMARPGATDRASVMASFYFEQDISFLFPYINAVAKKSELHERPCLIRFVHEGVYCVVYPDRCIASPFESHEQVLPGLCPFIGRPMTEQVTYPVVDEGGHKVSSVTLHVDTRTLSPPDGPGPFSEVQPCPAQTSPGTQLLTDAGLALGNLPEPLTPREIQVLALMGEGKTNPEISDGLCISPHTVKSHVVHIFNKLGVNQRTQAVVWAARHGII